MNRTKQKKNWINMSLKDINSVLNSMCYLTSHRFIYTCDCQCLMTMWNVWVNFNSKFIARIANQIRYLLLDCLTPERKLSQTFVNMICRTVHVQWIFERHLIPPKCITTLLTLKLPDKKLNESTIFSNFLCVSVFSLCVFSRLQYYAISREIIII